MGFWPCRPYSWLTEGAAGLGQLQMLMRDQVGGQCIAIVP